MESFLPTLLVLFLLTLVYVVAALPWVTALFVPPEQREASARAAHQPVRQAHPKRRYFW